MRFILTAIGSYGDVHPMVGLGAALAAHGHRVSVVANPYFTEVVEGAGLELLPISSVEDYVRMIEYPHMWHPIKAVPFLFREVVVKLLRPLHAILDQHYVEGKTVVVAHVLDAASRVFRDQKRVPVATVVFSPYVMWSRHEAPVVGAVPVGPSMPGWWNNLCASLSSRLILEPVLCGPLNQFRRELGLPAVRRPFPDWWLTSDVNVCLFPDWFAPVQPDWPRPVEAVGFPLWDAGDRTMLPAEVETFLAAGEAPIVFTPGTANVQAASFFQTAVDVCRKLGRRGIMLTKFAEQVPTELPDTTRHFAFVPLTRLLPRAAAFVHHGGVGSSSQGLAAGVPHIVRPLAFDQFDNAARLCRLGAGEQLTPKRFTTARVCEALERLTTSESVRHNCEQLAARCDGAAALTRACELLEALASTAPVSSSKSPVPS